MFLGIQDNEGRLYFLGTQKKNKKKKKETKTKKKKKQKNKNKKKTTKTFESATVNDPLMFESFKYYYIQSNLDSSNTDSSFTMANSNSFLSSYEILPIALKNKYLGEFSYFITKLYVLCTH